MKPKPVVLDTSEAFNELLELQMILQKVWKLGIVFQVQIEDSPPPIISNDFCCEKRKAFR